MSKSISADGSAPDRKDQASTVLGDAEAGTVALSGRVRIADAARLKATLAAARDAAAAVSIEAGGVEQVDTSILQLLVAFELDTRCWSIPVEWKAVSAAMREAASSLGMYDAIWARSEPPESPA